MNQVIFVIGHYAIATSTVIHACAFVISTLLAVAHIKRKGFDPVILYNTGFVAFFCGFFGGHLISYLSRSHSFLPHPFKIIMLWQGGFSSFGGLLFAGIGAGVYLKMKRQSIHAVGDLFAPYAALALAIARLACFIVGCCYGKEAACGIWSPAHQKVLIPTQLISCLALLVIFIVLRLLQEKPHRQGEVIYLLFALFGIERFLVEFWRGDVHPVLFGLTPFQLLGIVLIGFACVQLARIKKGPDPQK